MTIKKTSSRWFSILCLGMLILISFGPVYAASSMTSKSVKAANEQSLFQTTSHDVNTTNLIAPPIGNGTTMRDIVLVIDTTPIMAYETSGNPNMADAGDDPSVCNTSHTCQPLEAIKAAALAFTDLLFFPSDQVSIVTMTSQYPGGTRIPVVTLALTGNKSFVKTALNEITVFQPPECPTVSGPCLMRSGSTYLGNYCPIITSSGDPSSCVSTDVGTSIKLAGNELLRIGSARPDAQHIVVALVGGPANASVDESGIYLHGFCPPSTWVSPFCRDAFSSTRHFNTDPNYDAEDYARDMSDFVADPIIGVGAKIFTIGLGDLIQHAPAGDPGAGEKLLQYIALTAGDNNNVNHGVYYYSPDTNSLGSIFQSIVEGTICSPAIVVVNNQNTGVGSLRQAISDVCLGGAIAFDPSLSGGTIYLASPLLIDKGLTINGSSLAAHIQISGDTNNDGTGDVSVFQIGGPATIELNGLDIVKGNASGTSGGGGIANYGTLIVRNSTLSGNSYTGGIGGGGIYNKGDLTLINSTVTGNLAEDGGGIFNEFSHTLTVMGSTFTNNTAQSGNVSRGTGGAIANIGTLFAMDNTFLGNVANLGGGAIVNSINGTATLANSSFTNNSTAANGGAVNNFEGSMTIETCTFTDNSVIGGGDGGAIYNKDKMNMTGSTFTGNSGPHGGGISNLGALTMTNSNLSNNLADYGGGISNVGTLTITNSTVSGNSANITFGAGGGILNNDNGILTVTNSTISNNSSSNGGGIFNLSPLNGIVAISNSTLSGNTVPGNGGAISNFAVLNVTNSTLFGNSAVFGGGIFSTGTLALINSTISGNTALTNGGGLANFGTLDYSNTIIANSTGGEDCYNENGTLRTNINNLVENNSAGPTQCGVPSLVSDPKLGALASNGGSTQTMTLLTGSPAIDSGDDTICAAAPVNNTSQNGVTRPVGAHCDIGSYEFSDTVSPTVQSIIRANSNPTAAASVDFTVTFSSAVTGVDAGDFNLTTTGSVSGATVSGISGTGSTYTVTVNTGTGYGTLRLNVVDDNSIVDGTGNPLGGVGMGDGNFATGEVYIVDKTGGDTTGVFRPSNGVIFLKNANTSGFADININYGMGGDYPIVGDWDGDGKDTIGVYRNGVFYLRNSNTVGFADISFAFGTPGDQPIAGDWDGDGVDTVGVFHGANVTFYLRNQNTTGVPDTSFQLGLPGDVGIAGDWNGDGKDTTGVFRPSNGVIFLKNTNTTGFADVALNYGIPGDQPVTGDWDSDGADTIGVFRNGQFFLRNSNTVGYADLVFALGFPTDMPIAGNWDGKP